MQRRSFFEYKQQCSKSDLAFFDLLKSIAELRANESTLSALDIEQIQIGAKALNGLIARHMNTNLIRPEMA